MLISYNLGSVYVRETFEYPGSLKHWVFQGQLVQTCSNAQLEVGTFEGLQCWFHTMHMCAST